jgi:hypothetical protein
VTGSTRRPSACRAGRRSSPSHALCSVPRPLTRRLDFQEPDVRRSFLVDRDDVEHPHEPAGAEHQFVARIYVVGLCRVACLAAVREVHFESEHGSSLDRWLVDGDRTARGAYRAQEPYDPGPEASFSAVPAA